MVFSTVLAERVGGYLDAVDRLAAQAPIKIGPDTARVVAAWL